MRQGVIKNDSPCKTAKFAYKKGFGIAPEAPFRDLLLVEPYFFLPFFEALRFMKKPAAQPTMPPKM